MDITEPMAATAADPFLPRIFRVRGWQRELLDAVTLDIAPDDGMLPPALPGQFNMLYAFGVGEIAVSFSAINNDHYLHTVRDVGMVSAALTSLPPGGALGVRGPFGTAWPVEEGHGLDVVIAAGGLGLAPLRPAIRAILAQRERFNRVAILFGSRNPDQLLYRAELEHWRALLDVQVEVTVDHADGGWHGHVGVLPTLLRRVEFDPAATLAMVCGPEIMMRFTAAALADAGVPPARIHLSMERNMKCAIALCGHCQFGPHFICKDGAVMTFEKLGPLLPVREI